MPACRNIETTALPRVGAPGSKLDLTQISLRTASMLECRSPKDDESVLERQPPFQMRARFLREARAVSAVRHPNVIEILDIFELEDGTSLMVMELLEGETLGAKLKRDGALSVRETARILRPAVSAVTVAHTLGIVHRDLKPENIFLSSEVEGGLVKILDFGIAKFEPMNGAEEALTLTGSLLGTPHYMAPEQAFGEKNVDRRADVWALGVVLYECLSGCRPVEGENAGQVLKQLAGGSITPLGATAPRVPADLANAVAHMLRHNRTERAPDLAEIHALLVRYESADHAVASDVAGFS